MDTTMDELVRRVEVLEDIVRRQMEMIKQEHEMNQYLGTSLLEMSKIFDDRISNMNQDIENMYSRFSVE